MPSVYTPLLWGDPPVGVQIEPASRFHVPAGTVTFLLSDIEGSTRLWSEFPEEMGSAVAETYAVLDRAIVRYDGVRPVEQGEGDSAVAAFSRASDAVAAALQAQRELHSCAWPEGMNLRVRIALHTAEAQLRDEGNYFGLALSRCARLRAIAYGGQTLLSRTTRDLVVDRVPEDVQLVDCGTHRLRDLGRPEHVFALVHPDLDTEVGGLRSLDAFPNNLPEQLTSFVGRAEELRQLRDALADTRLLTLTGAGGAGKTRLALQLAAETLDRFPDGVWWVPLGALVDGQLVSSAVADALSVRPLPGRGSLEAVIDHLGRSQSLLLLDDCEHLIEAAAEVAETLLRGCPNLTVLTTSRAPLGVGGETDWRVPSLSLPREPAHERPEVLRESDAVRLFVERAMKVRPNFAIGAENAPAIVQICRALDGIPLAIELAAARVRVMSVEQIAIALGDRFRLLTGGARTALPRQHTLRASVDWSHDLLSPPERMLFRRLAVFVGGWTLDAAEQVCAGDPLDRYAILDLMSSLVEKSLVVVEERQSRVRYRLLETVRDYALERLTETGEADPIRDRHRDAYLELAERAEPELVTARQRAWLEELDPDAANLYAAIAWAAQTKPLVALRLSAALIVWWRTRGRLSDGLAALARALEAAPENVSVERASALYGQGWLACYAMDVELAISSADQALQLAEQLNERRIMARVLVVTGMVGSFADPGKAITVLQRSCELAQETADAYAFADAAQILAMSHTVRDDFATANSVEVPAFEIAQELGAGELVAWHWIMEAMQSYTSGELKRCLAAAERAIAAAADAGEPVTEGLANGFAGYCEVKTGHAGAALERLKSSRERSLAAGAALAFVGLDGGIALAQASLGHLDEARAAMASNVAVGCYGYAHGLSQSLYMLAAIERLRGDLSRGRELAEQAREVGKHVGSDWLVSRASLELGRVAAASGDWLTAEASLHEALGSQAEHRQWLDTADTLDWLAAVAAGLESFTEAARLLGAADRARRERDMCRYWPEAARWHGLEERLRDELGAEVFETSYAEGLALTTEEAVGWVRRARGSRKRPSGGWASLTPTELHVVELVAEGLTNLQIGERMFISRGTVKVHLAHIFQKLDVKSRSELTALAVRRQA